MILKCKREREESLSNPNALSTHKRTTITHEKNYDAKQQFILLIYNL